MKTVWKLIPCPLYDVESLQSWLEDMAAGGLHLRRFRLGTLFAVFFTGEPAAVRYRLSATRHLPGLLDSAISSTPDLPDEEEWQLSDAAGWHYVAGLAEFYVYRCEDPGAPELNTDPQVQALSYKHVRSNARWRLFSAVFYTVSYPLLTFLKNPFLFLIGLGGAALFYVAAPLAVLWDAVANVVRLERLTRRLKRGEVLHSGKDWRRTRKRFFLHQFFATAVVVLMIVSLAALWRYDSSNDKKTQIPLQEYDAPLPFATLEDLAEGDFLYDEESSYSYNRVGVYRNLFAPVRYDFEQHGVTYRDGRAVLDGNLYVDYYETVSPWLARRIAWELPRTAYRRRQLSESYTQDGVDVALYDLDTALPYLVLRRGSTVMGVEFFTSHGLTLTDILPELIAGFAP